MRTDKPKYIIIMEYCNGKSLREYIEKYKKENKIIPENQIIRYMIDILQGIKYLHNSKIIHRDLKPDNIMLNNCGNAKIGDFGISKQLTDTVKYAKTAMGTLQYASLEVMKGEKYNHTADIWSLGCIFYELCCHRPPYIEENCFKLVELIEN